uniref:riboflavin kinase n=1 Tax=Ditylenchus dipsaci TaxID=166011 RepID=A0A915EDU8_9BILA
MTLSTNAIADSATKLLPYFFRGKVVYGFGRGGKKLNCPTANLEPATVVLLPNEFPNGVYAGFAKVDKSELYPMVMSVGYNPHFNNEKKTLEVHILKEFDNDFYDSVVEAVALEYIRPMQSFTSLGELIDAIESDKDSARSTMNAARLVEYQNHSFFSS